MLDRVKTAVSRWIVKPRWIRIMDFCLRKQAQALDSEGAIFVEPWRYGGLKPIVVNSHVSAFSVDEARQAELAADIAHTEPVAFKVHGSPVRIIL